MMKYIFVPHIEEIPEWKQCYYDKETLSKLVKLCDLCHNLIRAARRNLRVEETTLHSMKKSHKQIEAYSRIERISRYEFILRRIIEQANKKFHEYSDSQIRTLYLFAQMKSFQLKQKVANLKVYNLAIERGDKDLAVFIENGFIEAHYLKRMIQYNRAQQSIVQRQYQLHHQELQISQIHPLAKRLDRVQNFVENIAEEFENLYKTNTVNSQEQVMREVINYSDEGQARNPKQSYSLGFSMGIVIICLAALLFFKSYHKIDIQTNKVYQSDFPIWRGASYLVAYQWILGFSLMFLEKTQINYKLILNLEGLCLPKSRSFLFDAQVTTIMFLSLFLLYMLEMAKVINTGFRHFGHIMWLVEIIYFLVPLPFTYRQGKIYFLKLLATVILSPLPFIKSSILIIWISQQIVSFSQPIVDFTYAVCKLNDMSSKCDNTPDINLGILVTIFTYRMIQNLKVLNQNNFRLIPPFYGVFRAFSSMLTAITSYVYRKQLTDTAFGFFCTVAFITTCIAIFVDLKADWGLFQDKILRKNLFFVNQKYFYYICIVIDVILRCNWVLNISPSFVNNLGILPFYLIMIVSYLELLRRGMWNIFRIESIHVQNCSTFKATIDDKPLQNRIRDKCLKYIDNKNEAANKQIEQMNTIRQKSQMELVLQNLRDRDDYKYEIQTFLEIQMKQVKQIQAQIQAKLTA